MSQDPKPVSVSGEAIRLGQFMKLADLVDAGSDVRPLVSQGRVRVNGDVETRRGRQLSKGDVVQVAGRSATVA